MPKAIVMGINDNVATALENISRGQQVELIVKEGAPLPPLAALEDIPYGNKLALAALAPGYPMIKYGAVCGKINKNVAAGQLVHVHNTRSERINIPDEIISDILREMNYTPKEE